MWFRILIAAAVFGYILIVLCRKYRCHGALRCPHCRNRFPKPRDTGNEYTAPQNAFTCKCCGCRIDEFSNALSFPDDADSPEFW